jgi:hypothetical protein
MKQGERFILAELRLIPLNLTPEGRDAIVSWLRNEAVKLERTKCGERSWDQPLRLYRLRMGR